MSSLKEWDIMKERELDYMNKEANEEAAQDYYRVNLENEEISFKHQ
jgi:hypothetical protein